MGVAHSIHAWELKLLQNFLENLNVEDILEDLDIDGMILMMCILMKLNGRI